MLHLLIFVVAHVGLQVTWKTSADYDHLGGLPGSYDNSESLIEVTATNCEVVVIGKSAGTGVKLALGNEVEDALGNELTIRNSDFLINYNLSDSLTVSISDKLVGFYTNKSLIVFNVSNTPPCSTHIIACTDSVVASNFSTITYSIGPCLGYSDLEVNLYVSSPALAMLILLIVVGYVPHLKHVRTSPKQESIIVSESTGSGEIVDELPDQKFNPESGGFQGSSSSENNIPITVVDVDDSDLTEVTQEINNAVVEEYKESRADQPSEEITQEMTSDSFAGLPLRILLFVSYIVYASLAVCLWIPPLVGKSTVDKFALSGGLIVSLIPIAMVLSGFVGIGAYFSYSILLHPIKYINNATSEVQLTSDSRPASTEKLKPGSRHSSQVKFIEHANVTIILPDEQVEQNTEDISHDPVEILQSNLSNQPTQDVVEPYIEHEQNNSEHIEAVKPENEKITLEAVIDTYKEHSTGAASLRAYIERQSETGNPQANTDVSPAGMVVARLRARQQRSEVAAQNGFGRTNFDQRNANFGEMTKPAPPRTDIWGQMQAGAGRRGSQFGSVINQAPAGIVGQPHQYQQQPTSVLTRDLERQLLRERIQTAAVSQNANPFVPPQNKMNIHRNEYNPSTQFPFTVAAPQGAEQETQSEIPPPADQFVSQKEDVHQNSDALSKVVQNAAITNRLLQAQEEQRKQREQQKEEEFLRQQEELERVKAQLAEQEKKHLQEKENWVRRSSQEIESTPSQEISPEEETVEAVTDIDVKEEDTKEDSSEEDVKPLAEVVTNNNCNNLAADCDSLRSSNISDYSELPEGTLISTPVRIVLVHPSKPITPQMELRIRFALASALYISHKCVRNMSLVVGNDSDDVKVAFIEATISSKSEPIFTGIRELDGIEVRLISTMQVRDIEQQPLRTFSMRFQLRSSNSHEQITSDIYSEVFQDLSSTLVIEQNDFRSFVFSVKDPHHFVLQICVCCQEEPNWDVIQTVGGFEILKHPLISIEMTVEWENSTRLEPNDFIAELSQSVGISDTYIDSVSSLISPNEESDREIFVLSVAATCPIHPSVWMTNTASTDSYSWTLLQVSPVHLITTPLASTILKLTAAEDQETNIPNTLKSILKNIEPSSCTAINVSIDYCTLITVEDSKISMVEGMYPADDLCCYSCTYRIETGKGPHHTGDVYEDVANQLNLLATDVLLVFSDRDINDTLVVMVKATQPPDWHRLSSVSGFLVTVFEDVAVIFEEIELQPSPTQTISAAKLLILLAGVQATQSLSSLFLLGVIPGSSANEIVIISSGIGIVVIAASSGFATTAMTAGCSYQILFSMLLAYSFVKRSDWAVSKAVVMSLCISSLIAALFCMKIARLSADAETNTFLQERIATSLFAASSAIYYYEVIPFELGPLAVGVGMLIAALALVWKTKSWGYQQFIIVVAGCVCVWEFYFKVFPSPDSAPAPGATFVPFWCALLAVARLIKCSPLLTHRLLFPLFTATLFVIAVPYYVSTTINTSVIDASGLVMLLCEVIVCLIVIILPLIFAVSSVGHNIPDDNTLLEVLRVYL